jgi:hypothetical protein
MFAGNLRRFSRNGIVIVLASASTAICFHSQAEMANPRLVPSKSAYVVSLPDAPTFWSAWKKNALYDTWKKFMDLPEVDSRMANFRKELGVIESSLGYKLDGDTMSQIFKSVDVYVVNSTTAKGPVAGAALKISDPEKLNKLIDLAEKAAAEATREAGEDKAAGDKEAKDNGNSGADDENSTNTSISKTDSGTSSSVVVTNYKGVAVKKLDTSQEGTSIYYAETDSMLLVTNNEKEEQNLIDRVKGSTSDSFEGNADYQKINTALVAKNGEAYMFGNQTEALSMQNNSASDAAFGDMIKKFVKEISPISIYGVAIKVEPKKVSSYSYGLLADNTSDSLAVKYPGDKPLGCLAFVPAKTMVAMGYSLFDASGIYNMLDGIAKKSGNKSIDQNISTAELVLGFSVKNDLLPALGNEISLAINAVKFGTREKGVDATLIFSVKDKAKMNKVVKGIEHAATNAMAAHSEDKSDSKDKKSVKKADTEAFKDLKVGDTTARYLEIPAIAGLSPGYAITDNYLVIGSTKEGLKAALEAKSSGTNLPSSDALKALAPAISTNANMFQYWDFANIWSTGSSILDQLPIAKDAGKYVDLLKVMKTSASNSHVEGGALVNQSVLVLE